MNKIPQLIINLLITLGLVSLNPFDVRAESCHSSDWNEVRTYQDLQPWKNQEQRILIDIRSPESFSRVHAVGSINLPGFSLKYRSELKNTSILLVAEPYQFSTTRILAKELLHRGFKSASILYRGLYSAESVGFSLSAVSGPLTDLISVSANTVATELAITNPMIVLPADSTANDIELSQYGKVFRLSPESVSQQVTLQTFSKTAPIVALSAESSERGSQKWGEIVSRLVNEQLSSAAEDSAIGARRKIPIFVMSGGISAALKQLSEHKDILEQVRRSKEPKSCK
jgi:hypothetical protein